MRRQTKARRFRRGAFSLLELLMVIGILGVLCSLILPSFEFTGDDAKKQATRAEMREIQSAFRRFAADTLVASDSARLDDMGKYGLWPLLNKDHPEKDDDNLKYGSYDFNTGIGRRGPYLSTEAEVTIASNGDSKQDKADAGVRIPVILDPYGHHYRVVVPGGGTLKSKQRLALVCLGPNGNDDNGIIDLATTDSGIEDDSAVYEDEASGDLALRLLPFQRWGK